MMARFLPAMVAIFACSLVTAAPPDLAPANGRTNFFAGRDATLRTVIRGGDAVAGRLAWNLTALGRTLRGGTLDVAHDGGPATAIDVAMEMPDVKEGIVLEATLTTVLADAAGTRLAACARPVRIFSADPFFERTRWLEGINLALIDPVGDTERVLVAAGVPFTLVRTEADITAAEPRIIVVGEGTSWLEGPDLATLLSRFASRGVPVLCLAPRDGTLPLPGTTPVEGAAIVKRLAFERAGVVAAFDPRLDGRDWDTEDRTIVSRFVIATEGDRAVLRIAAADDPSGWPWVESEYTDHTTATAKLVFCGHGIVSHWNETPSARYLFAAILHRLTVAQPGDRPDSTPTAELPEKN